MKRLLSIMVVLTFFSFQTSFAQCIKGDCYNGQGTFKYESGAKYQGSFRKGKIHGDGILYFSNGNKYIGNWINQYREGKGKLIFANGEVYKGNFKKSQFSGSGTMTFNNGDKYVGNWAEDIQNGEGKYYYEDGNRYEGTFKKGKLHGQGTMYYKDGSKYVGSWKKNYKDGEGKFQKSDGSTLIGLWLSGKYIGKDGKDNNKESANEDPIIVSTDSDVSEKNMRDCNNNYCVNGNGFFNYSDGTKYVGEFENGMPQGQGTCFYANGDKYVGNWKKHAPHGEGIMYYKNGRVLGANWVYGKPVKVLESDDVYNNNEEVIVDKDKDVKIWAVIVGVARYSHMPVLKYTDDDAYQVYAFYKSPEGGALPDNQISVLIDEDATRNNILRTMRNTFLKADENDVVVLYFSGHGLPGSFLPIDYDGFNNKLRHEDIKAVLEESKAKHKLCLADACHSGTLMAMRGVPVEQTIDKYYKAFDDTAGGTALFLSSKGDEYSLEDMGLRQGVFSHYLIRGLKGEADKNLNKIVTIKELYDFVYQNVRTYTGYAQSPTITGDYSTKMPVSVIR